MKRFPEQAAWIGIPREQWPAFGFDFEAPPKVDGYWEDGQNYQVGELEFKILHCPGHTPGHVVLFEPEGKKSFCGRCALRGFGRQDRSSGWFD